jgi:hypothetical protein
MRRRFKKKGEAVPNNSIKKQRDEEQNKMEKKNKSILHHY